MNRRSPGSIDARARLWAHLVSEHAAIIDPQENIETLRDLHKHEHTGPGTIRDHDESSREYSLKSIGECLSESDS